MRVEVLAAACAILAVSTFARADACKKHSAEAEALFEQGRKLYDAGRYEEACERLEGSQRIEPSVGTLGLLAACFERQGRLASAWERYIETATRARVCGDKRGVFARDRATVLERRVPTLM